MKTGKSLQDLAMELDRQNQSKRDFVCDTRALKLEAQEDGGMILQGVNGGMTLRPLAHQQLASHLGIPKAYYDKCLAEAPDLLAANANRWLKAPARRLVRTLDGSVRAFLSDSYRPLDNFDLAQAALPKLMGVLANIVSCEVTENRLYIKAVTEKVQGEVKKGDIIQAGVVISNSEVGQGSLRVESMDYRLVCLNGMIREQAIRKAHLGRNGGKHDAIEDSREYFRDETLQADDTAFFLKVQDAIAAMFEPARFDTRLNQYRELADMTITADPIKVVEVTSKRLGLNAEEQGGVLQHLIRGADLSAWGLSNAFTRQAQDVDDYDRATELEVLGGKVTELARSDWKSMMAV